ncbi:MAG: GatB/YqeY domain-containing protein [Bacteroidetes bacterium]|nr:GatB/YqeY domain-containing protein [Bacteroidota bacterium]
MYIRKAALLLLKSSGKPVTAEDELKALQKMVKQRKESAEIYQQQNRSDLAGVELFQISVIEQYLPKQMSEEEIKSALAQIISQVGATTPADMGKVMGAATRQFAGKADGKAVAALVKELLIGK